MRSLNSEERALGKRCWELVAQGRRAEDIIAFLRAEGCEKTKTIAILADVVGVELARAKEMVHFSATWADARERDEKLHEILAHADKSALDGDFLEQERKE